MHHLPPGADTSIGATTENGPHRFTPEDGKRTLQLLLNSQNALLILRTVKFLPGVLDQKGDSIFFFAQRFRTRQAE